MSIWRQENLLKVSLQTIRKMAEVIFGSLPYGAHNWQPMSYSKKTGYIYIPVQTIPAYFSGQKEVSYKVNRWNTGVDLNESRSPASWVAAKASLDALVYGELSAGIQ